MAVFLTGFGFGFSLILAIGAQNAFVLRQGLRRAHVFWVCLTCALCDTILITVGVVGFSALANMVPWLADVMRWAGATFLFVYGLLSLRSAYRGSSALYAKGEDAGSRRKAILTAAALAFLNPHVYLDTVMLLGSIASQYPGDAFSFWLGACLASFVFFFGLGYGARTLTPVFARPSSWRVLDVVICLIMWSIALGLILHA